MSSESPPSSSPATPSTLSPDVTGVSIADSATTSSTSTAAKKARNRQTAFYPNMNAGNKPQKPFSRSAAKRESVMALGSIEHLQHYFTKTGLAAKTNPLQNNAQWRPALGNLTHVKTPSQAGFQLPPSPAIPQPKGPQFPPTVKTYETDPETLLPGVVDDLNAVAHAWGIDPGGELVDPDTRSHAQDPTLLAPDSNAPSHPSGTLDVLGALKTTTRAVRSIRNYVVSLPDDSGSSSAAQQFRPKTLSTFAPMRPKASKEGEQDPLTLIRRAALDVLTVLRELEESARVPLEDDVYDAQSDHGSSAGTHSRVASPNNMSRSPGRRALSPSTLSASPSARSIELDDDGEVGFSLVQVKGRQESVPVWENSDDERERDFDEEERLALKREAWDERLVLGSGYLYAQDVKLANLGKERRAVQAYLGVVDNVLFGGARGGKRGWVRAGEKVEKDRKARGGSKRRASSGGPGEDDYESGRRSVADSVRDMTLTEEPEEMETLVEVDEENEDIADEDLPAWAQRTKFVDDPQGRAYALLTHLLPASLLPYLRAPPDLLAGLSSGQLLCVAYNAGVRRSRRPWGYISKDAIHDIVKLQQAQEAEPDKEREKEKGRKEWTFRRTDNLRLWAAALKIRYLLPVVAPPPKEGDIPGTPAATPSPTARRFNLPSNVVGPPIIFDARVVARREPGWEEMLSGALDRWVDAVVRERRGGDFKGPDR